MWYNNHNNNNNNWWLKLFFFSSVFVTAVLLQVFEKVKYLFYKCASEI